MKQVCYVVPVLNNAVDECIPQVMYSIRQSNKNPTDALRRLTSHVDDEKAQAPDCEETLTLASLFVSRSFVLVVGTEKKWDGSLPPTTYQ